MILQWVQSGKQDVYLDVADRYRSYIRLGVIVVGEKLPSVREAAQKLGVNPNTVAKAYAQLEKEGLVRTVPKKGVFVTAACTVDPSAEYTSGTGTSNTDSSGADDGNQADQLPLRDGAACGGIETIRALKLQGVSREMLENWIKEVYGHD